VSDSIRVTNLPDSGSPERVAFDLANKISLLEKCEKDRAYWLDLYHRCLSAVHGTAPRYYE